MKAKALKSIWIVLSVVALSVILGTSIMVFRGMMSMDTYKAWTNTATLIWFVTSPLWMIAKKAKADV